MVGIFFAAVGYEQVKGAIGEEKLVGLVIDFLSAKIPNVDFIGLVIVSNKFPAENINALGGDILSLWFELIEPESKQNPLPTANPAQPPSPHHAPPAAVE
jgi:hypothetical protein